MKDKMLTTKKLVITALFTALIAVATVSVQIPLPFGYANLGDAFVLLSALILGGLWGATASGLGSALADIILGFAIYAPATFIIKGLVALVASLLLRILGKHIRYDIIYQIIACIVAEFIMIAGYFFYEAVVLGYSWGATASIVGNVMQAAVGIVIALLTMTVFSNRKIFLSDNNNSKEHNNDE